MLIPRWLRRDSHSSERAADDLTTAEPDTAADEKPLPRSARSRREAAPEARVAPRAEARPEAPRAEARPEAPRAEARPEAPRAEARPEAPRAEARPEAPRAEARPEAPRAAARPEPGGGGPREEEHKGVLAARRRLLGMLLALLIGSGALAFTRLAAWWVIVPPLTMLLGYMALLRETAKADAERRELVRSAAATARSAAAAPAAPPAPSAPLAPPPDAEVIDISASLTVAGEEFYDQYADAKLRAVGDLARALVS